MEDLILRDYLALERTHLANERTFLTYARTALTCLVAGISLNKLFPHDLSIQYLAWVFLGLVPLIGITGVILSWRMHLKIKGYYTRYR